MKSFYRKDIRELVNVSLYWYNVDVRNNSHLLGDICDKQ